MSSTGSLLTSLECRACCTEVSADRPFGVCPTCGQMLAARYDLAKLDAVRWRASLEGRPRTLWRYRELLPVRALESIVTLGEGYTPILPLPEVETAPGVDLLLKDDGLLPTGSFKARGMAVAVSRAVELGLRDLFVPSAGNAGIALAAYGARAGVRTRVYLPETAPPTAGKVSAIYGADVTPVSGTIQEVGEEARRREKAGGSFDMSTLREPYRVEGKKTMGFELFEQLRPEGLPDAIIFPAGGGTGIVGMHKAFEELRSIGLLDRMPRLIAVQSEGCAPLVRALDEGTPRVRRWDNPHSIAPGLLVPDPFSSERVLEAIRDSHGTGIAVTGPDLGAAADGLAREYGVSVSLEGAAPYAALERLARSHRISPGERILLYNTGAGAPFAHR